MAGTKRGRFFDTLERQVRKRRCRRYGRKIHADPGKRRGDLSRPAGERRRRGGP